MSKTITRHGFGLNLSHHSIRAAYPLRLSPLGQHSQLSSRSAVTEERPVIVEQPKPAPGSPRQQRQIVTLLFVVALINYFDRQSLSVVAPRFQAELHLSDQGYGHIVSLFLFASAIAYAIAGFISDALGTRRSM